MTWVRDSDDVYDDELLWEADVVGSMLWSAAMRECAKRDGDGVLSPMLIDAARKKFRTTIRPAVAVTLVELGLWHDEEGLKRCAECQAIDPRPVLPSPRHRYIHAWPDHLLDAKGKDDRLHRRIEQHRTYLRKGRHKEVLAEVRRRDRDECQYCGILTRWETTQDRRSKDLGEPDHVDPFADDLNHPDNVVVACKGCNSDKKQRTPAQWHAVGGRLLLRAPGPTTDRTWVDHRSTSDPAADPDLPIGDPPRVTRDSGPGRDPNQADPGSGPGDHGSDQDRDPAPDDDPNPEGDR